MRTPTLSVIIPTKGRPDDIMECVDSILRQDHLPQELVVIDQSTAPIAEKALKASLSSQSLSPRLIYLHAPEVEGLPQARNLGVSRSKGEIIMFLDDDVVLENGYIAEILHAFSEVPEAMGLGGTIRPCPSWGQVQLAKIFCHGPFRGERELLALQHCPLKVPVSPTLIPVGYLSGCNMSFRRSIFAHCRFDERLIRHALGEDIIFSYLVAQHHKLFLVPTAQAFHKGSLVNRLQRGKRKEAQVFFYFYFFMEYLPKTPLILLAYLWCNLGLMIGTLLKIWDLPRVRGLLQGYVRILRVLLRRSSLGEELRKVYD